MENQKLDTRIIFSSIHTARTFTSTKVPLEIIKIAWEEAKFAPTAFNSQPLRLDVIKPGNTRAQLVECMSAGNRERVSSAPLVIVLSWDEALGKQMEEFGAPAQIAKIAQANASQIGPQSGAMQAAYLLLALRAQGLGVGPMTGFDSLAADTLLHKNTSWRSFMVFCVGYTADDPDYVRGPRPTWEAVHREWQ